MHFLSDSPTHLPPHSASIVASLSHEGDHRIFLGFFKQQAHGWRETRLATDLHGNLDFPNLAASKKFVSIAISTTKGSKIFLVDRAGKSRLVFNAPARPSWVFDQSFVNNGNTLIIQIDSQGQNTPDVYQTFIYDINTRRSQVKPGWVANSNRANIYLVRPNRKVYNFSMSSRTLLYNAHATKKLKALLKTRDSMHIISDGWKRNDLYEMGRWGLNLQRQLIISPAFDYGYQLENKNLGSPKSAGDDYAGLNERALDTIFGANHNIQWMINRRQLSQPLGTKFLRNTSTIEYLNMEDQWIGQRHLRHYKQGLFQINLANNAITWTALPGPLLMARKCWFLQTIQED